MTEIFDTLTQIIQDYPKIYIMTHKNPDLDGLGSAICLYTIIKSLKKECFIIDTKDPKNRTVQKMYEILEQKNIPIEKKFEKEALEEEGLLIILDVHKNEMVESKKLLEKSKHVIVLDHHIKGNDYIKPTDLCYIRPISSVTEMMVYYLKYLNKTVDPVIASIMLTGIEIDTNHYNLKTTEKTYEAASILASFGADLILKQELFKEEKEAYIKKSEFIKNSRMINKHSMLTTLDQEIYPPAYLAEIAEQILQFDHIEVSFTIGNIKQNVVGISARSLGNIDVNAIMEKLGGGGHITDAATQIKNTTIKEVETKLLEIVGETK